jgi:hypothetical protein
MKCEVCRLYQYGPPLISWNFRKLLLVFVFCHFVSFQGSSNKS